MRKVVIRVAAAVIERDGQILIGQRKRGDSHALKWEFPGGKIEAGEHAIEALIRELREELGIEAVIGPEIARYTHQYPRGALIKLIFYRVTEFTGDPASLCFEQILWDAPGKLPEYDFVEGDLDFVRRLATGQFAFED